MPRSNTLLRPRSAGLAALAICGLLLSIFALRAAIVGATGETILTLVPVGEARAGELITVRLVAHNARDLAGFQGTVGYDAPRLRLAGANVEADLARRGRGLLPLGPVMGAGSVALGAVTCPFSCAAAGLAQGQSGGGASGTLELGTLEFYSATAGSYTLSLTEVKFVDPQGNPLEVRTEPLVLEVRARRAGS